MFFKKKKKSFKENLDNISVEENFSNLIFFTKIISKLEYFIFFGTLLGLVREKNLIEGDDDIDLYVNINHRDELINILQENSVDIDLNLSVNKNRSFLQVKRIVEKKDVKSNTINFPAQPIYLCEFLYGKNWQLKLKKDKEYEIKVINGKPVLFKVKKTFFGSKSYIE